VRANLQELSEILKPGYDRNVNTEKQGEQFKVCHGLFIRERKTLYQQGILYKKKWDWWYGKV